MTSQQHNQTLFDGPAMKPPTGVKPDFNHPANKQGYFILTFVLTVAVSTLAIIIRMYTKVRIIRKVGWEDCMVTSFYPRAPLN